jgi:hypothetical protein
MEIANMDVVGEVIVLIVATAFAAWVKTNAIAQWIATQLLPDAQIPMAESITM